MRRNILVTHADAPIGRRLIKALYYDDRVDRILAVGAGPPPNAFDRFLASPDQRVAYARVDLARHRSMYDLFHSTAPRSFFHPDASVSVIEVSPGVSATARVVCDPARNIVSRGEMVLLSAS